MGNNTQGKNILAREFSSGGVVYKRSLIRQGSGKKAEDEKQETKVLWLIRKTVASQLFPNTFWMLPKGWLDDAGDGIPGPMASGKIRADEKILQETAIREVKEETGVNTKIIDKIETVKYFYNHPERGKVLKFVTFYLMEWTHDLPEGFDGETSEIAWLPFEEALKTLSFNKERKVLEKAKDILITIP